MWLYTPSVLVLPRENQEDRAHPQPYNKFEAKLGYVGSEKGKGKEIREGTRAGGMVQLVKCLLHKPK